MALTVALQQLQKIELQGSPYGTTDFIQVAKLTFDTSYPAGGYTITPSQFNLNNILGMTEIGTSGVETLTFKFDAANSAIRVYAAATFTATLSQLFELGVGASLNNVSSTWLAVGV